MFTSACNHHGSSKLMLRALYWTFHVWRALIMRFIFCGRGNIRWSCIVTFHAWRSLSWSLGVSKMGQVRSPKQQVRDNDFAFGSCSDHAPMVVESSFFWRKQFGEFALKFWTQDFVERPGVSPDAPRIVHVTQINNESHFLRQAQYLLKLKDDSWRSAYCTGRFMCYEYQTARINAFQDKVMFCSTE